MLFENIKEHEINLKGLKNIIDSGNIPPSMLFHGKEGIGKYAIAREFAKICLCRSEIKSADSFGKSEKTNGKCLGCESCRMFDSQVHPDFLNVDLNFQAAIFNEKVSEQKSIGIDTIREAVKFANLKPSFCSKKFIIINDCEKMTVEAQNSLLKTLEEPFEGTNITLISSSVNNLLPTILSRCYKIHFNRLNSDTIMDILIEKGYEIKRAELLSKISQGSVSLALKYDLILNLFEENSSYHGITPFLIVSRFSKNDDFRETAVTVLNFINSFLYFKMENFEDREKIIWMIKENFKYKNYLKYNVNTKLVLSTALCKFFMTFDFFKRGAII